MASNFPDILQNQEHLFKVCAMEGESAVVSIGWMTQLSEMEIRDRPHPPINYYPHAHELDDATF